FPVRVPTSTTRTVAMCSPVRVSRISTSVSVYRFKQSINLSRGLVASGPATRMIEYVLPVFPPAWAMESPAPAYAPRDEERPYRSAHNLEAMRTRRTAENNVSRSSYLGTGRQAREQCIWTAQGSNTIVCVVVAEVR